MFRPAFVVAAIWMLLPGKGGLLCAQPPSDAATMDQFLSGLYKPDQPGAAVIVKDGKTVLRKGYGMADLELNVKDSATRLRFELGPDVRASTVTTVPRCGMTEVAMRTGKPVAPERKEITLPPESLEAFVGEYQLAPTFSIVVTREGSRLLTQATGQQQVEVFPESQNTFFLKVVDARIEFQRGRDGKVTGLVLYRGGQQITGKKVR